jgi:hypothetical protein
MGCSTKGHDKDMGDHPGNVDVVKIEQRRLRSALRSAGQPQIIQHWVCSSSKL